MSRKKYRKPVSQPPDDDLIPMLIPELESEEEAEAARTGHVYHPLEERPDLMADLFEDITSLVEEFVKEHGREPTGDELADMVLGDLSEEELELMAEDGDELAWILGIDRDLDEWGVDEEVDPHVLSAHCANCGMPFDGVPPLVTIGARLSVLPFRSHQDAAAFYVPLPGQSRLVGGILVTPDSPAKKEGWDLVFVACCEKCGKELRRDLAESITTHLRDLQN